MGAIALGLILWATTGGERTEVRAGVATVTSIPAVPTTSGVTAAPSLSTPEPTGSPNDAAELPPALPAVPFDKPATVERVAVSIVSVEPIDGHGVGPGNVSGPALRVTVRIHNSGASDVPLDGVSVNLSYGLESTPGPPVDDPSRVLFAGTVGPGESADGIYVFRVPLGARELVTVEVGHRAGAPRAQFSGPAG